VAIGHRRVAVRADVDWVQIECEGPVAAEYARRWERHCTIFEPIHYMGLLERKPDALDFARPLTRDNRVELSRLIDLVNGRFGTEFTRADELFFH
jgi:hypothetical protein